MFAETCDACAAVQLSSLPPRVIEEILTPASQWYERTAGNTTVVCNHGPAAKSTEKTNFLEDRDKVMKDRLQKTSRHRRQHRGSSFLSHPGSLLTPFSPQPIPTLLSTGKWVRSPSLMSHFPLSHVDFEQASRRLKSSSGSTGRRRTSASRSARTRRPKPSVSSLPHLSFLQFPYFFFL